MLSTDCPFAAGVSPREVTPPVQDQHGLVPLKGMRFVLFGVSRTEGVQQHVHLEVVSRRSASHAALPACQGGK